VAGNRFVEVAFPFPVCFFDGTITIAFLIVASKYAVLSVDDRSNQITFFVCVDHALTVDYLLSFRSQIVPDYG